MAAEVRCPMCGKSNPADAEVCQYCRARLKPVITGGGEPGGAPSGEDEPDWLRQLRSDDPKSGNPPASGSEPAADLPDWLSRIREKTGDTENTTGLFADEPAGDADPDWMKGLQGDESPSSNFGASDDWLSRLGGEQSPPEKPAASSESAAEEGDLSGWLQNLGQDNTPPAAPTKETPVFDDWSGSALFTDEPSTTVPAASQPLEPAADDQDDWLSKLNIEPDAPAGQPADQASAWDESLWADKPAGGLPSAQSLPAAEPAAEENFDWLRSFAPDSPAETPAQPPAEPEADKSSGGWGLTGWLDQKSVQPEPSEPGRPDWSQPAEASPDQAVSSPQEDLPDWLSSASSTSAAPEPLAPDQGGVPSWLMDDQSDSAPQHKPAESPAEGNVPAWLAGFDAVQPPTQPPAQAQPPAADNEDLPAWMRGDFGAEEAASSPQPEQPSGELPGWFSTFDETSAGEPSALPLEPSAESDQPDFSFSPFSLDEEPSQPEPGFAQPISQVDQPAAMDEQPDWLQSLQAVQSDDVQPEPATAETGPTPFVEEGLPDWMNEFKAQSSSESSTPPLIPVEEYATSYSGDDQSFYNDLPDWLSEDSAERQAVSAEQGEGQVGDEDLAQAELPSWVAAMRPVETAMQDAAGLLESDQRVEKAGPLSGMRGVLPADDRVINYRKPPVYSVKLRVSEKQRGHAGLLEGLLGQEVQPLVLPAIKSQAPQIVLRVLVALFMLLALGGSLLVNLQLMPVPTFYPPEVMDLYDQVEALPADATVLLAVDFQPGLSGEMQFASSMVIDHLMGRNAQMAIVSTVPTGPAMADSLLRAVQKNRSEYDLASRVENLGYLPGGTISLVEFARDPRGAAPQNVEGENAWEQPALLAIDDIQKFARVIVITDRAEIGRDWVEQVQPYLGDVPLLIVSSAQAAPLLEPYVESRQVQGMVSGLMGGTLYGQRSGRQAANPALGHYGAYQVGVLLAFVLVLVGAIFSALASTVKRKQKNRE